MNASIGQHVATPATTFLDLLRRRWWIAVLAGALVAASLVLWFQRVVPLYEAQAKLVIDPGRRGIDTSAFVDDRTDRYSMMNTQRDLLVSYPILQAAVETLHLDRRQAYAIDPVGVLEGRLKALTTKDSWVLDLSLRDEDPRQAEEILGAVIEQYRRHESRRHEQVIEGSIALLRVQAAKARTELTRVRDEEQGLRMALDIVSDDAERNPITERISQLEVRLMTAERDAAQADGVLAGMAAADALPDREQRVQALVQVPDIRRDNMVQTQYQQLGQLLDERRAMLKDYLETNPEVVQLDGRIATARDRLEAGIKVVRAGILHQHETLIAQRDELRQSIAQSRAALSELRRNLTRLKLKSEETTTAERIFQALIDRQHAQEADSLLGGQVVTMIEEPHAAPLPVNIRRGMSLVAAALLGLVAAAIAAWLAETFDRRIRDTDAVTEHTDLPTFGLIPHADGLPPLGSREAHLPDRRWQGVDEAIRMMRSTLQLSGPVDVTRIIAITSPSSGEGRTTVVSRLGMSLAAAGRSVLVIDADLRQPALHRHLGMPEGAAGLAELLAGSPDAAPLPTSWPRLHLLPAGRPTAGTAELLESPAFHQRLSDFTASYDYILFDTPSLEFSEALELGAVSDHILLVVRDRFTLKQALRLSQIRLGELRAKVLGLVVNDDRTLTSAARTERPIVAQSAPVPATVVYRQRQVALNGASSNGRPHGQNGVKR